MWRIYSNPDNHGNIPKIVYSVPLTEIRPTYIAFKVKVEVQGVNVEADDT
jgi:hypothetical protein